MRGSYMNDPCRSERGGERDDESVAWQHIGFGVYVTNVSGSKILIRPAKQGRTAVAYVVTVAGEHVAEVPFDGNRKAALLRAKAAGVERADQSGPFSEAAP